MGKKQNQPLQPSFNALLKVDFQLVAAGRKGTDAAAVLRHGAKDGNAARCSRVTMPQTGEYLDGREAGTDHVERTNENKHVAVSCFRAMVRTSRPQALSPAGKRHSDELQHQSVAVRVCPTYPGISKWNSR